ncbi:MAG: hypothetical protein ABSD74_02590 [Rhizomicrobium sp.]|jgi:hypothetical protein
MATLLLVAGAAVQFALPESTKLPDDSILAPRRVRESPQVIARDYPAVLANPVFAPDRKPDATAVPVSGGMNGFAVLGVGMVGDTATALVRGPGGMVQRLKPGGVINGYRLIAVQLDQLTFERNNERHMLSLSKSPGLAFGPGPGGLPFRHGLPGAIGPLGARGPLQARGPFQPGGPFQGPNNGNANGTNSSSSDDSDDDSDDDNDN